MSKRRTSKIERLVVGGLTGIALMLACYAALSRYLFPQFAEGWVDELVIYLMVWAMWLSGGMLVSEHAHVRADLLQRLIAPAWAERLSIAIAALGFAFCAIMTYGGIMVVLLSIQLGEYGDSTIALPVWLYYVGFPIGMGLMGWRYLQVALSAAAPHSASQSTGDQA